MMDGMMGMGWMMVLWVLIGLAVLALLILGIIWLVRSLTDRSSDAPQIEDPAQRELRRHYAAGEIDQDEYQQRLDDLRRR
ncbi:MAG: SHOCT domain-containing protein [Actinophytocola sp.]|nr:SHOCT domain-containing protein [Actinophytocola sp.]